jgi:class 3 adenylate cyclase
MSQTRQLAAIMFTDIVGYTKLMQQSESTAVVMRDKHRAVFDKAHQVHHGKTIQYYGDGTLSIFSNTLEAVRCGIMIQRELAGHPKVPLRIGIHLGDVLLSDSDIVGDSVNIASRVESMGVAGAILVSDKVWEETKNQNDIKYQPLGTFHFKNDHQSRNIYAVKGDGLVIPETHQLSGKLEHSSIDSLAILGLS